MERQMERKNVRYYTTSISTFFYLSHMPVITAACSLTSGPVLELGAGFGSTFALHGICAVMKRDLLTIESDKTWLSCFNLYRRSWHKFQHVTSFVDLPEYKNDWGLAFVDHGILGERGLALSGVRHVPVIVAHDTNEEALNYTNDGVPQVLDSFKYRWDYRWLGPATSVLSDSVDVEAMFKEIAL